MKPILLLILLLIIVACSGESDGGSISAEISTRSAEADADNVPTDTPAPLPTSEPTKAAATPIPATDEVATAEPAIEATDVAPTATNEPPTATPTPDIFADIEGALVSLSMQSDVGVLLDGLPDIVREQMAEDLLNAPAAEWEARAERQLRLARLRLNFRNFNGAEGQLPLPPQPQWVFELDPAGPSRQTINDHDLIMHTYTFRGVLLSDAESLEISEPGLAEVGDIWEEPFIFPADPDHLLQRTGNACLNEGGFPPNSYDAINAWHFYDYTCEADSRGSEGGCHRTSLPNFSCRQAVSGRIGEVAATMQFERLAWDDDLADSVRTGDVSTTVGPDLVTLTSDMEKNRIIYRYFDETDCAFIEGATGGSGWRRLLLFEATVHNTGTAPMHMGKANAIDDVNNVFIYAPCHAHFHYSNYGDFFIRDQAALTGGKQAFCVQSTNRHSNNETSPLIHDYTCTFQGIEAGWVDEYVAGLDAQWVDITDLDLPEDGGEIELGFSSNLDKFMCEGTLIKDEDGEQLWEPSDFLTSDGHTINRPQCDFVPDWDTNNLSVLPVFVPPTGGYVTQPCTNNVLGPLRNCGFTEVPLDEEAYSCTAGEDITFALTDVEIEDQPFVARACQRSDVLGGVACERVHAVTNWIAADTNDSITFTCPRIRDSEDGAGGFSLYVAPVYEALD